MKDRFMPLIGSLPARLWCEISPECPQSVKKAPLLCLEKPLLLSGKNVPRSLKMALKPFKSFGFS